MVPGGATLDIEGHEHRLPSLTLSMHRQASMPGGQHRATGKGLMSGLLDHQWLGVLFGLTHSPRDGAPVMILQP
ncbi:MAG TPA: hypothetical protein DEB06_06465 [Phycisphaerales bacterium]|nr:hypothetical protein [Phycisphaerales bacterium]